MNRIFFQLILMGFVFIFSGCFVTINFFGKEKEKEKNTAENTFKSNSNSMVVNDIDGNVYKTITIGSQTWMAENLKTTRYRNGDKIQSVLEPNDWANLKTGALCYSNNEISNKATYGTLYNYYAVVDFRNIAPVGWHIPTDAEWETLVSYLGGFDEAGAKLKEERLLHWKEPNSGANNTSGFNALPAGYRNVFGVFSAFNICAYWWSFTPQSENNALYYYVRYESKTVIKNALGKTNGFSIRCIKD